jgi:hypothetical protein
MVSCAILAEAMREEYKTIVEAGFILQKDGAASWHDRLAIAGITAGSFSG